MPIAIIFGLLIYSFINVNNIIKPWTIKNTNTFSF